MKPNEIKKALELYNHTRLYITKDGEGIYIEDVLNLLNTKDKEIERLKAQIAVLQGWVKKQC